MDKEYNRTGSTAGRENNPFKETRGHHSDTKTECHEGAEEEDVTLDLCGLGIPPKETGLQWGFDIYMGFGRG